MRVSVYKLRLAETQGKKMFSSSSPPHHLKKNGEIAEMKWTLFSCRLRGLRGSVTRSRLARRRRRFFLYSFLTSPPLSSSPLPSHLSLSPSNNFHAPTSSTQFAESHRQVNFYTFRRLLGWSALVLLLGFSLPPQIATSPVTSLPPTYLPTRYIPQQLRTLASLGPMKGIYFPELYN